MKPLTMEPVTVREVVRQSIAESRPILKSGSLVRGVSVSDSSVLAPCRHYHASTFGTKGQRLEREREFSQAAYYRELDERFPLQTSTDRVLGLEYHAVVCNDYSPYSPVHANGRALIYAGSMPSIARERITDFKEIVREYKPYFTHDWDWLPCVTIHSHEPLPIRSFSIKALTDPLVVAWSRCPYFRYKGRFLRKGDWYASLGLRGHILAFWGSPEDLMLEKQES